MLKANAVNSQLLGDSIADGNLKEPKMWVSEMVVRTKKWVGGGGEIYVPLHLLPYIQILICMWKSRSDAHQNLEAYEVSMVKTWH